jgi:hypothetical protein
MFVYKCIEELVVGYGSLSLCVIHKEGLCSSSGNIMIIDVVMITVLSGIKFVG